MTAAARGVLLHCVARVAAACAVELRSCSVPAQVPGAVKSARRAVPTTSASPPDDGGHWLLFVVAGAHHLPAVRRRRHDVAPVGRPTTAGDSVYQRE